MKIIEIRAKNHREVGEAIAKKLPNQCKNFLRFIQKTIPKRFSLSWSAYKRYISPLIPQVKKYTPDAWQYLNGISLRSKIPFIDVFATNAYDLLDNMHLKKQSASPKHCTAVLYRSNIYSWLAYTDEWDKNYRPYYILLRVKLPRYNFSAFTFPLELPGYVTGFNSYGLVYASNTLHLKNDGYGIPLPCVLYSLHASKTSSQYLLWLKKVPIGSSVNINFLEKQYISSVECRRDGKLFIQKKTKGFFSHTNHPVKKSIFKGEELHNAIRSQSRLDRADTLMKQEIITPQDALEKITSDTEGKYPIFHDNVLLRACYDIKLHKVTYVTDKALTLTLP